jgi:hypothetical protein
MVDTYFPIAFNAVLFIWVYIIFMYSVKHRESWYKRKTLLTFVLCSNLGSNTNLRKGFVFFLNVSQKFQDSISNFVTNASFPKLFMNVGTGVQGILWFCLRNLRSCNVGITGRRIYKVRRWDGLRWHGTHTMFGNYRFKHSCYINVISLTILGTLVLVLLIGWMYELLRWDELRGRDIHTKFHKNWFCLLLFLQNKERRVKTEFYARAISFRLCVVVPVRVSATLHTFTENLLGNSYFLLYWSIAKYLLHFPWGHKRHFYVCLRPLAKHWSEIQYQTSW